MHHNNYNWYSTNSYKRYQKTVPTEPRLEQYSDEGRVPLGRHDDPENIKVREQVIASVTPEELEKWAAFCEQQRELSLMARRGHGLENPETDPKYRTFPIKSHTNWEADGNMEQQQQGGSEAFQMANEYRSRYVLNRKVNPRPTESSAPTPPLPAGESTSNDAIYIDDSGPSASTGNVRMVVSGEKITTVIQKQVSPRNDHPRITITAPSPRPPAQAVFSSVASSTSAPPSVRECVLAKYGHCFGRKVCGFAHNGKITKERYILSKAPLWKRMLPGSPVCPGYANFSCWDVSCPLRHTVYPSDTL